MIIERLSIRALPNSRLEETSEMCMDPISAIKFPFSILFIMPLDGLDQLIVREQENHHLNHDIVHEFFDPLSVKLDNIRCTILVVMRLSNAETCF